MISKEAIQRIKDDFEIKYDNLKNEKDRQNIIGLCEVIEKDLEVLEILKNKEVDVHVVNKCEDYIAYNTMLKYRYVCSCDKGLREDEYNKIKEWLEQ